MPKRILIFSIAYHPFIGGAEIAIKEVTDRIPADEYVFDVITPLYNSALPREETVGNVMIHRVGFGIANPSMTDLKSFPLHLNKYLFPFLGWWKATRLAAHHTTFDVVWGVMANYAGFAALFFKLTNPKLPFLITLQEGDPIDYIKWRVRYVYPVFKMIFKRANFIQAISNYLGEFAKEMGYTGSLAIIPNAVEVSRFVKKPDEKKVAGLHEQWQKKQGDVILITTSRLVAKNAVDDVIRALPYLPLTYKFVVVGDGPDLGKLKFLASETHVDHRLAFVGEIPHEQIATYLHAADIFIRPSLSEGLGNSFLEAMAAGLPVIATPVGGIVDFLFDPERNPDTEPTGIFCEVKNAKSIAAAIKRLTDDAGLRERISKNARVLVIEKYDWDNIAGRMQHEVFDKLSV